tara:strand:- start:9169 stop:9750 length:582 start_codon:yes stop_codon:yes gene_type:complete
MKQVKLTIPNEWCDITIETYQKYLKIQKQKGSEKNKVIKSMALLCNTSEEIVKKMDYTDLLEITKIVSQLVNDEPDKSKFKKRFQFMGKEYGFIPNLSKLTTGEYIDLETYCKNPIENLHTIMSILYREVTFSRNQMYAIESYDPGKFKEELFKQCPMDIALGSLGFFLTLGEKLAKISLNYLTELEKKTQKV